MRIGIDIGGTKILVAAQDEQLGILGKNRALMPCSLTAGLSLIKRMVHELADGRGISSIGVACGGPLDNKSGTVSPLHCPEWRDIPLKKILEEEFSCSVVIEVDTDAAALAEYQVSDQIVPRLLYVTLSTGLGGGFLINGEIYRGQNALHPEVGHQAVMSRFSGVVWTCGAKGCLEAAICGNAILSNYNKKAEELSDDEWQEVGQILGQGLRNMIMLYAPQIIVLGGSMALGGGERLRDAAQREVDSNCFIVPACAIKLSTLGSESSVLGALLLAHPHSEPTKTHNKSTR